MTKNITARVKEAVAKYDIEETLKVLEEADLALTGVCRFSAGQYWRQFVTVDFERFFKMLKKGEEAINTVKLGDEVSKLYVEKRDGEIVVYLWAPEEQADTFEKIWTEIM